PLEDPWNAPDEDVWEWTIDPKKAPEEPTIMEIEFKNGVPIKIDGESMNPIELIDKVNRIAGLNGIGRIDHIEDRIVGIKSREVYECPAALTIIEAHKDLEKMVLNRRELTFKKIVDNEWTFLIYAGLWEDPLRYDLEAFINKTSERVEGIVKMKLYKGSAMVIGRESPYSLYDIRVATYDSSSTFDQSLSKGFVTLWGLQTVASRKFLK
ncbi:MAG: argininosuccinate synthase, partial [Candidatus Methanomethyliaceae archaeon]|nr:argininosuccinate synthase [Candidatus Methanomethyliaceae archaeon]